MFQKNHNIFNLVQVGSRPEAYIVSFMIISWQNIIKGRIIKFYDLHQIAAEMNNNFNYDKIENFWNVRIYRLCDVIKITPYNFIRDT